MNFKVGSSAKANKTSKSSKSNKASSTESASFGSALDNAMGVTEASQVQSAQAVEQIDSFILDVSDDVPSNAKQRGYYILDALEELEKDILSGTGTKSIQKLEKALNTKPENLDEMPESVKTLISISL